MPELDELQYAEYQRVQRLVQQIGKNPKATKLLQEAVAEAAPEEVGPEIRIRNEVNERLSGIEKLIADDKAERAAERERQAADNAQRDLERRWGEGRAKVRAKGLMDDGLPKLEEFMEKNGIADHELALAAYEKLNPPPPPAMSGGSHWNFFDKPADEGGAALVDRLMKQDFEGFLGEAVPLAIAEVRGR